jgi:curved DNA-binding protein
MEKDTFTDYYEILQVSPTADREMIERAYRLLAKRYHPDNAKTGDAAKFDILVEAYRVFSDTEKRTAYDDRHKTANGRQNDVLFNVPQSRDPDAERRIREAILSVLYLARRRNVMKAGVGIGHLERLFGLPEKEMEFHIWYLKEKGWIQREDTGGFAITVDGIDAVIEKNMILREDRLLIHALDVSPDSDEVKH